MPPIQEAKAELRTEMRARRRSLAANQPNAGQVIGDLALAQGLIPPDAITALFWPIGDEVDLRPLLERLAREGRPVVLPCTPNEPAPLIFRRWTPETSLKPGPMRTMEPNPGAPELVPNVLLLPLLAFDSAGRRIGYGGGYYDRTLKALRQSGSIKAFGVAFAGQQVPRVPTDALDQQLDGVITERGVTFFQTS
ncbi:5-formyltetrahydrofolate cyclo-ligase [Alphaproteobacteria bacterium]|nr:5-formyltetrahydrofolate cyclo-ligase [Alphaproteobacteria bacterium]